MATEEKVVLKVELQDVGDSVENVNKGLKVTRNTLDQIEKLTNKPASRAKQSAFGGALGDSDYGTARGIRGTGASARDFAKESQGLGGLVRLYATYAANVFAVGAAFRALSSAADTANIIQGLDQLGAVSGKSLGSLSKRLADASEGAISLRDSMTAVAQTSAAGMSSTNILRMGEVAKKAAQALGISMPDALSRLSRGITKLEPELLDELGIFTKIDQSNQDYARQLGKTASALTDFEKRQGFANAVLSEGESKFNNIKIDVNPWEKLLASVQNLTFKGLDLLNTFLGPLVRSLSESPVALTAAIAGIANMIIKRAIPAIGMWREELKRTADEALLSVTGRSTAAKVAQTQRLNQAKIDAEQLAEAAVTARDEATKKLEALSQQKFSQSTKRVSAILEKPVLDVTPQDLKYLNDHAEMNEKTNKKLAASYREVADTIVMGQAAETKFLQTDTALAEAKKRLAEGAKATQQDDLKYREMSQSALLKHIAATTAANTKELGYVGALRQAYIDLMKAKKGATLDVVVPGEFVKDERGKHVKVDGQKVPVVKKVDIEGISNMSVATGLLSATTAAATSAAAAFISRLGTLGVVAGILYGAFQALDTIFSDSTKQQEKYRKESDLLADSIENVTKTVDAIRGRDINKIFSIESVQARANAFKELTDNLTKTNAAFEDLAKSRNGWDKFVDDLAVGASRFTSILSTTFVMDIFKGKNPFENANFGRGWSEKIFGKGDTRKQSDNLAGSIIAAIKATESGPAREQITKELSKLVGFDTSTLDIQGLQRALDSLSFEDLRNKSDAVSKVMARFSHEANNNASALTELQDALKATGKSVDALTSSLTPNDPLGKIGVELINNSTRLDKALRDPTNSLLALKAVTDDPKFLSLLPDSTASGLIAAKQEIDGIAKKLGEAREKALQAKEELQRLISQGKDTTAQRAKVEASKANLAEIERNAKEAAAKYSKELSLVTFEASFKYLEASLKGAMAEGAIIAAKGYVSVLAGAGANTAKLDKALRDQEFAMQRSLIDAQYSAREAQEKNTIALERANILAELKLQADKLSEGGISAGERESIKAKQSELTKSLIINENKKSFLEGGPTLEKMRAIKASKTEPGKEDLMKTAVGQMGDFTAALYGKQAQLSKIAGAQEASNIQAIAEGYSKAAVEANKKLDVTIKDKQIELSKVTTMQTLLGSYDQELASKKEALDIDILRNNAQKEQNTIQANINTLKELEGKFIVKNGMSEKDKQFVLAEEKARVDALIQAQKDLGEVVDKAKQDEKNLILANKMAGIDGIESLAKRRRESALEIAGYAKQESDARLSIQEDELNYRTSLGLVTSQEAATEKANIDRSKQQLVYEQELLAIETKRAGLKSLQAKIDLIKAETGKDPKELIAVLDEETKKLDGQKSALQAVNEQRLKAIDLNEQLASKMTGFSKIVEDSFQSMADALADFARTGKLDFKSLVDGMLVDLLRFELRAQMSALYAGMGGLGGMMDWGKAFLGIGGGNPQTSNLGADMPISGFDAKGHAYDAGLRKFAMGGTFTNSIVDSPTLFKFSKGTGMMGEAGPEAIMPLHRGPDGSLGVRNGGGGKVDVVVNNFGNEKATTKETVDSRGNRKIEVVIGEMVAGEMSRSGSPVQQSLSNNFGSRPAVARR